MNTFTNSTVMVEYAKVHSAELIRQAHLANGGSYVSQQSGNFSSWRVAKVAPIKNAIWCCIVFFGLRDERGVQSGVTSPLQLGTSNG